MQNRGRRGLDSFKTAPWRAISTWADGRTEESARRDLFGRTLVLVWLLTAGASGAWGQPPATTPPATETPPRPAAAPAEQSEAEKVATLQRSLEDDAARLDAFETQLDDPASDYNKARLEFSRIDAERTVKLKEAQRLREAGQTADADAIQAEAAALDKPWNLAKERFQLLIDERKTLRQQIANLQEKIARDQVALDKLFGIVRPQPDGSATAPSATPVPTTATPPKTPPSMVDQALGMPAGTTSPGTAPLIPLAERPPSPELQTARAKAQQQSAAAQVAQGDLDDLDARIQTMTNALAGERELRESARKKADNATETERELVLQVQRKMVEAAPQAEIDEIWKKSAEARARAKEALDEYRARTDRIEDLQAQYAALQADKQVALSQAEQAVQQAQKAQKTVADLENPYTIQNILRFFYNHSLNVIAIVSIMYFLHWCVRLFGQTGFRFLLQRGSKTVAPETENRTKTLAGVMQNAALGLISLSAFIMVMNEIGIDVAVLLGGVAVIGLAVAFGAQNLIKDYFTGLMILVEDQYTLNNVIKIGAISGQVENFTLRVTVLRDQDGSVHFVPNGTITAVTNMTHEWSRALFEIPVSYQADIDQVIELLKKMANDIRADTYYSRMILDAPTMLGVESFSDSAVMVRFFIKTRPLMQWELKRELLRRIKNRFDELGIDIPIPQRMVFHQWSNGHAEDVPGVKR